MARPTRVLAIADMHCGSVVGLTHPHWHIKPVKGERTKRDKWAKLQRETWDWFERLLKSVAPIDVLLYGGDGMDGKGERAGSTEQITCDMEEQTEMAIRVIQTVLLHGRGKNHIPIVGVYGTPCHVSGDGEDWENILAQRTGFQKIGAHEWPSVSGYIFDLKHKVGGSTIPHGRHTALAKDMLWNAVWHDAEEMQPKARCILRAHVHYHSFCGTPERMGMTLPALQAMGTKFGARQCSGLVHWGVTTFDVSSDGKDCDWHAHTVRIKTQVAHTTKVGE